MEKMERRNSYIITIVIIIIGIISLAIVKNDSKKLSANLKELKEQNTKLITQKSNLTEQITALEEENKKFNNTQELIENIQKEYYNNIAVLEQKITNNETNKKIIYLTFDDGPYDLTSKYLDVLKENNVRATFFVLGKPEYINTYKRMKEEGHTIANHTYHHAIRNGLYNNESSFVNDVEELEKYLEKNVGVTTNLVRFPGGSSQSGPLKDKILEKLRNKGYGYVDWTCYTGDGSSKLLQEKGTYDWFISTLGNQKKAVLLMHDYNYSTYNDLNRIIKYLKKNNYVLAPLYYESTMVNK